MSRGTNSPPAPSLLTQRGGIPNVKSPLYEVERGFRGEFMRMTRI